MTHNNKQQSLKKKGIFHHQKTWGTMATKPLNMPSSKHNTHNALKNSTMLSCIHLQTNKTHNQIEEESKKDDLDTYSTMIISITLSIHCETCNCQQVCNFPLIIFSSSIWLKHLILHCIKNFSHHSKLQGYVSSTED